jgi:DNA-directed RNA polymerase specialized sigma24 family protein
METAENTEPAGQGKTLEEQLSRFLAGELGAANEFYKAAKPHILGLARRIAPELPSDIHPEVVNQTFVYLLEGATSKFDPKKGSAKNFLRGYILNAVRHVRATYCAPGRPTRKRNRPVKKKQQQEAFPAVVSLDTGTYTQPVAPDCDAETVLNNAPEPLATALELVYFEDKTMSEAAMMLHISRFQLSRQISAYAQHYR